MADPDDLVVTKTTSSCYIAYELGPSIFDALWYIIYTYIQTTTGGAKGKSPTFFIHM